MNINHINFYNIPICLTIIPIMQLLFQKNGINLTTGWYDGWYNQTLIRLKTQKNPKNRSL